MEDSLKVKLLRGEKQDLDLFDVLANNTVLMTMRDSSLVNWGFDPEKDAHQ